MFDIKYRGGGGVGWGWLRGGGWGGGTHFVMVMGMLRGVDPFFKALVKMYI